MSLSIHLDYRAPPPAMGERIACTAQAWRLDHGLCFGEGPITDAAGAVLASASLRSLSVTHAGMAYVPRQRSHPPLGRTGSPAPTTPDRPVARIDGPLRCALAPLLETGLAQLCSIDVVSAAEGTVELSAIPPEQFLRTTGVVHGGALGLLAHLGLAAALLAGGGAADQARRLDFHVDYLRPAAIGSPLVLRAWVAHRSRKVAVVSSEIAGADGRLLVLARETCLLPPG